MFMERIANMLSDLCVLQKLDREMLERDKRKSTHHTVELCILLKKWRNNAFMSLKEILTEQSTLMQPLTVIRLMDFILKCCEQQN